MIRDPLLNAALHRAVTLSADIEVQLSKMDGCAPVVALLEKARLHAAAAVVALADVEAEDPKRIRALQNELKCFDRIVQWLGELVAAGFEADTRLAQENREDYAAALGLNREDQTEDEEDQ